MAAAQVLQPELTVMPPAIRRLLNRLRWRDRWLASIWALACGLCLCLGVAVVAGLVDSLVDLWVDTPAWLHLGLLGAQVVAWVVALLLLARALLKRYPDDRLALWIEQRVPSLGHRLISSVQLNRPGADTRGMSTELIAAVTHQAEREAAGVELGKVCDNQRLRLAALTLGPALLVVVVLFAVAPATCGALLSRLFLNDVEIPRRVHFATTSPEVWPAGEEGVLRLRVTGRPHPETTGTVRIQPDNGPVFRTLLSYEKEDEEGMAFSASVPPSDVPFRYRAWLGDGRLRHPGQVRYAPRPVASSVQAWVLLPERLGKRRDGSPYTEAQRGGDIVYQLPDARARVLAAAQIELSRAWVRILGKKGRIVPLKVQATRAEGTFALRPGDSGYEVHLVSADNFECADPPRRSIRVEPLEPPEVVLLPETFWREGDSGTPEEREVEGIPILRTEDPRVGRRFRLAYRCQARYGLSHARLRFRVIPAGKDLDAEAGRIDRSTFLVLPLGQQRGRPVTEKAREEFSTRLARDPDSLPDKEGRGRYDFQIDGIPDGRGGYLQLKEGDRIQFYVEAFGKADPDGPPGRSTVREKEVVGRAAYLSWLERKDDLKERTRYLEEQQRGVRAGDEEK
jgi:hypothetical protein